MTLRKFTDNQFVKIKNAFETLKDEKKKKIYDTYGEDGLKEGMAEYSDPFGHSESREQRTESKLLKLEVDLEDCYTGKSRYIEVTRYRTCSACKGNGSSNPNVDTTCGDCDGSGYRVVMQQMGFAVMQSQVTCKKCRGQGFIIKEGDKCKTCQAQKAVKEKTQLEVFVEKGCPDKKRYKFDGESDEVPGALPGDVFVEISVKEHKKFIRQGGDLVYTHNITLLQALTGFSFILKHLDGRPIKIMTNPGEVIQPGKLKTVYDLGMPFFESPSRYGNLYINFNIQFPVDLTTAQLGLLRQALAGQAKNSTDDDVEEKYTMSEFKKEDENTHHQGGKKERF